MLLAETARPGHAATCVGESGPAEERGLVSSAIGKSGFTFGGSSAVSGGTKVGAASMGCL
jgi:hypothetical protein